MPWIQSKLFTSNFVKLVSFDNGLSTAYEWDCSQGFTVYRNIGDSRINTEYGEFAWNIGLSS